MAWWNLAPSSPLPIASARFQVAPGSTAVAAAGFMNRSSRSSEKHALCKAAAPRSEGVADSAAATGSSAQTQLDLLEQLTSSTSSSSSGYEKDSNALKPTIREQLSRLIRDRDGEFSLLLGRRMKDGLKALNKMTISQKRNIKRQNYLNEVSQRNDSVFFATIGAFVILPPVIILSVAIITGYVQLFP